MKSKLEDLQKQIGTFKINRQIDLTQEIQRKLFHLIIAILPILYFFLSKTLLLFILVPICSVIILVDHFRHQNPKLARIFNRIFTPLLRDHEKKGYTGATYFSIAALITFILFSKTIAINAFLILAISDSCAAIFGKKIISKKFFEKSMAGSLAFFLSAVIIVIFVGIIFKENIFYYLFAIISALVATIIEARPNLLKLDDNLTIPLSFSLVFMAFATIWFQ